MTPPATAHRYRLATLFEKYRRRYSPYNSVASLYLWAVAGGVIEGMKDYAATKKLFKFIEKSYYHCKRVCSGHIEPQSRILNPLIFVNSPLLTAYLGLQSAST